MSTYEQRAVEEPVSEEEVRKLELISQAGLFRFVRESERVILVRRMHFREACADEVLIKDGDSSERLFVIDTGRVRVSSGGGLFLTTLEAGDVVGDWGVLTNRPRTATITAMEPVTYLELTREELNSFIEEDRGRAHWLLRGAGHMVDVIRSSNALLSMKLDESHRLREEQAELLRLTVAIVGSLSAYTLLLDGIRNLDEGLSSYTWLNVPITLGFGGLVLWLVWRSRASRVEFGLHLKGAWRAAAEGVGLALAMAGCALVVRYLPPFDAFIEDVPLVVQVWRGEGPDPLIWGATMALYCLIIAPVQELVVRGVLQSSLERLGEGRGRFVIANVVSNVVFATTHLVYSHEVVALVFCFGMLLGGFSRRHESIIGVVVAHSVAGALLLWFIGFVGVV